ncbi:hypothetical protein AAVH_31398 [Aphelenchoides avenae]|nr:hypothetical protein AAVH_31398 [Aphelenchus avenae]
MRLPSENVLDVLQCVDFATLLAVQRSASSLYGVIRRNQSLLPRLRVFGLLLDYREGVHELQETVGDGKNTVLRSSPFNPYAEDIDHSLLHFFRDAIGTNFVDSLSIRWTTAGPWMDEQLDVVKAVEALPVLKNVHEVSLQCRGPFIHTYTIDRDLLRSIAMKPLDNLQYVILGDVNLQTDWSFLRDEWALRLRSLSVAAFVRFDEAFFEVGYPEIDSSGQDEIFEYCTDFVHLPKGKSKTVELWDWQTTSEFQKRVIKIVAECDNWLTVLIGKAPGFTGNEEDYVRSDLPAENHGNYIITNVRYASRDGSHRVFVQTFPEGGHAVAVTNNPFITTFSDTWKRDLEAF